MILEINKVNSNITNKQKVDFSERLKKAIESIGDDSIIIDSYQTADSLSSKYGISLDYTLLEDYISEANDEDSFLKTSEIILIRQDSGIKTRISSEDKRNIHHIIYLTKSKNPTRESLDLGRSRHKIKIIRITDYLDEVVRFDDKRQSKKNIVVYTDDNIGEFHIKYRIFTRGKIFWVDKGEFGEPETREYIHSNYNNRAFQQNLYRETIRHRSPEFQLSRYDDAFGITYRGKRYIGTNTIVLSDTLNMSPVITYDVITRDLILITGNRIIKLERQESLFQLY